MEDGKKAIIIGIVLVIIVLLAFSSRFFIYDALLEMHHDRQYNHGSLRTANIISTFLLIALSALFSWFGYRKAQEKGYDAKLCQ